MNGQVIGKTMPHGYAGSYSRQPDSVINTRPAGAEIPFGIGVAYDNAMNVVPMGTAGAKNAFVGVAVREIKSATDYLNQNIGKYNSGEAVPVMMRGSVNVVCQRSTPSLGGAVYVRTALNEAYPNCVIGGFEAENDEGKTTMLGDCQLGGQADANGIAELVILKRANA